jgi:hypothetical protein
MKGLADIISRQMNAKESAGDKEIRSERVGLAKLLMNARPEIVIDQAMHEMNNADAAGEIVTAPIVSLKALVAKSKKEFEDSFPVDDTEVDYWRSKGIRIR